MSIFYIFLPMPGGLNDSAYIAQSIFLARIGKGNDLSI